MTADSIRVNPDWPMNQDDSEDEIEKDSYIFSLEILLLLGYLFV